MKHCIYADEGPFNCQLSLSHIFICLKKNTLFTIFFRTGSDVYHKIYLHIILISEKELIQKAHLLSALEVYTGNAGL